jgi:hypothetical protein
LRIALAFTIAASLLFASTVAWSAGGLSGKVAIRSTRDDPKPKGTWLIEQWVADFNFKNGEVVLQDNSARMDILALAYQGRGVMATP